MSSFYDKYYCPVCGEITNHLFADDTPSRHRYSVECQTCGDWTLWDVAYGSWEIDDKK